MTRRKPRFTRILNPHTRALEIWEQTTLPSLLPSLAPPPASPPPGAVEGRQPPQAKAGPPPEPAHD